MNPMTSVLAGYSHTTFDKLRYRDTDRQGHVNNAVFMSLLETGRVEMLYAPEEHLHDPGCSFVVASIQLDFLAEMTWPGRVEIGTRIASIGRSSMRVEQALIQGDSCVATAALVIVQMNQTTRRSQALGTAAVSNLGRWVRAPGEK